MNKEMYKEAFAAVRPSDEVIERIMNMEKTKKKRIFVRPLLVAAAIMSTLLAGGIVANAATDGAVADTVEVALQKIEDRFTIRVNGEQVSEAELDDSDKEIVIDLKDFAEEIKDGDETDDSHYTISITKEDGWAAYGLCDGDGELECMASYPAEK